MRRFHTLLAVAAMTALSAVPSSPAYAAAIHPEPYHSPSASEAGGLAGATDMTKTKPRKGSMPKAAALADGYVPLDSKRPVMFYGDRVSYGGREYVLSERTFFIDGQLSDEVASRHAYVFNSFTEAAKALTDGTPDEPMTLLVAPYVYWIDNPDDKAIRVGKDGREPFGLIVRCQNLHITGLSDDARNVVLASNRGQTQGAIGNFTMFDFWGDGLEVRNLTMGNYCNVNLEYPLKPSLNRPKRMTAITQAHVAYCHGDRILADNVRFISRLNMNPLNGAKRILFNNCHMESTDDALTGTGVYLHCTLDFYGQKPFWRSDMGGAVFLDCDFSVCHDEDRQYFCKAVGPLAIIDCRYHVSKPVYAGWTHTPTEWLRCYQYNVSMNGQPYIIGAEKPYNTVCMDQRRILQAYRLSDNEGVFYNTYNLLRGDDDWDPLHVRPRVEAISRRQGLDAGDMPTCLAVSPLEATIQTGGKPLTLKAVTRRHCNYERQNRTIRWRVEQGYENDVRLSRTEGGECQVTATNHDDETKRLSVIAYTDDGLECAVELTVRPDYVEAPRFLSFPRLSVRGGVATVDYTLDLEGRKDESLITWYRCSSKDGSNRIAVAVSRLGEPERSYRLTREDVGYYIMASVEPRHLRCLPGKEQSAVTKTVVKSGQVTQTDVFETDFQSFPCHNQPRLIPGFWTIGGYKPLDTAEYDWTVYPEKDYWTYGEGINGAMGTGLLQKEKGARMLYTPLPGTYGDMAITLCVDPSKTAGQGFGSATGQYLDLYIKFDTETLTGYALRIIRTTKYSNAVDFLLVRYDKGVVTPVSAPVSSVCYRTGCTISLSASGNRLKAHAETTTPLPDISADPNLKPTVDIEAEITPNDYGGTGIQHTGTCGESTTMLHRMRVEWK
ncbi:MAG: hypothetical protein ACI3Y5_03370 [Prevotella sp.]